MSLIISNDEEGCDEGVNFIKSRVRSFASDPLHSAAYLSNLAGYLGRPFGKRARPNHFNGPIATKQPANAFFYSYEISKTRPPLPVAYSEVSDFLAKAASAPITEDKSELVFLTGYPSPEWLNTIVTRYSVDHRFLHHHLDFLPSGQRDWYTAPDVPSRTPHFIRLLIPSIVFIGPEGRYVPLEGLHEARNACSEQLRHTSKTFFAGALIRPGQSIVRHVNIHSGDTIVIVQAVTLTILNNNNTVKILVWTDSGDDDAVEYVPVPNTDSFSKVSGNLIFCPVFFEKELQKRDSGGPVSEAHRGKQPLSALPSRYGETLDWNQLSEDPILILEELFQFQSAATIQYLNMLRKLITQLIARSHPIGDGPLNMEDILHFEYAKTVLVRWDAHFRGLIQTLDTGPSSNPLAPQSNQEKRKKMLLLLKRDLEFLQQEAKTLIELCESGKSTIMSNFSISESRRAAEESRLVTQLTKATNRLTFIFLPISFVTSVFGMNFRQFGQGSLSIWLWVAVTLPLLTCCVVLVEWGRPIASCLRKLI